jgi:hypothetical protein
VGEISIRSKADDFDLLGENLKHHNETENFNNIQKEYRQQNSAHSCVDGIF